MASIGADQRHRIVAQMRGRPDRTKDRWAGSSRRDLDAGLPAGIPDGDQLALLASMTTSLLRAFAVMK